MNILTKIKQLCADNSENVAMLERILGFGNGTISRWENSNPTTDKLSKVADHFGVTMDYLLSRNTIEASTSPEELSDVYLSLMRQAQAENISPEDIELAIKTIKEIRKKAD